MSKFSSTERCLNTLRQVDAFYWPTVDLVLWGVTATYIASRGANANLAVLMVVSGIVLWIILWRGQYEFTVNILEDVWNKNLINMFVSSLKLSEWIAAFSLLGLVKAIISTGFATLIALLLYHIKIFSNGFQLLPFLFLLLMIGCGSVCSLGTNNAFWHKGSEFCLKHGVCYRAFFRCLLSFGRTSRLGSKDRAYSAVVLCF